MLCRWVRGVEAAREVALSWSAGREEEEVEDEVGPAKVKEVYYGKYGIGEEGKK